MIDFTRKICSQDYNKSFRDIDIVKVTRKNELMKTRNSVMARNTSIAFWIVFKLLIKVSKALCEKLENVKEVTCI